MPTTTRDRCRTCGTLLPGWLAWEKAPDGALLLHHLGQMHRDQVGAYLDRMRTHNDVDPIAAEAYELVEVEELPAADQT